MGILNLLGIKIGKSKTNAKSFTVTEFLNNTDFNHLIESNSYLDQYIGWTYKAVLMNARSCAAVDPIHVRETIQGRIDEVPFNQSRILKDLYRFNDEQELYDARLLIHLHLGLAGIAFVYIADGTDTKDFYILNPNKFDVVTDDRGLPKSYKFTDYNGKITDIPKENLLVFRNPNPKNWLRGFSPVEASKYAHNAHIYASQFNMNVFGNQGGLKGFLSFDSISPEERKRVERKLREFYNNRRYAGQTGVLDTEPTWTEIGSNHNDLQYKDGMQIMRDEILAFHGIPAVLAFADGTYANTFEAQKMYAKYTIDPMLRSESGVYTQQLVPKYYGNSSIETQKSSIIFHSTMPIDKKEVMQTFKEGALTLDEARAKLGEGKDPVNGSKYYWQLNISNSNALENSKSKGVKKNAEITLDPKTKRENTRLMILKKIEAGEDTFLKKTVAYFNDQEDRVLKAASKYKDASIDINIDLEKEILIALETFGGLYSELAKVFNENASELVGNGSKSISDSAIKSLAKNLEYFATEINETTQKDLNKLIADAISNSLGLQETKDKIKELFDRYTQGTLGSDGEMSLSRAQTIARTETNKIKSLVSYDRYKGDEEIEGYEWLATGGTGSRETHNAQDGKVIKKGETFDVDGDKMRYPHDPRAKAKNVINCRCDILPVLKQ